jgi:hypothetical protein
MARRIGTQNLRVQLADRNVAGGDEQHRTAPASTRVISRGHSVCNDVFLQELPIKTIDLLGLLR